MRAPGRTLEQPINARPVRRAATIAAVTAAILPIAAPPVAAAAPGPSPIDTGSLSLTDLHAVIAARATNAERADRATRKLYPPPPRHVRGSAVVVAVMPPPAPAPVVPVAPVKTYAARHAAPMPKKTVHNGYGNGGGHYVAPPASGSGSAVVNFAESFLGVRYQMNGVSRSGIDCSGLVMVVYAKFGIRLDHKASSFYGVGRAVSRADLQPGDILIMDGGGHAGIYVGNGLMIHAPHTGTVVQISPIWSFSAARRVL